MASQSHKAASHKAADTTGALDDAAPLLLVGAGKMGGAMLAGWLERGLDPAQITILDPGPPAEIRQMLARYGLTAQSNAGAVSLMPRTIVMAVKPQQMDEVFATVAPLAASGTTVLSVAAGRTIASLEAHLGEGVAVVRTIPNTPAAIGRGITVCCGNDQLTDQQRATCNALLRSIGEVEWVADEALIDVATGVSGSGPAYVFYLTECLAEAGRQAGLDEAMAMRLARATVSGAGDLMHQSETSAAGLRKNVTSPGGTTAAALAVLMDQDKANDAAGCNLQDLMTRAVAAAVKRAKELSS